MKSSTCWRGRDGRGLPHYRYTPIPRSRDQTSQQQFSDRFTREAKVIAWLNHPNFCTLFDVGPNYLVMESIDGPTLTDRIRSGPLDLKRSSPVCQLYLQTGVPEECRLAIQRAAAYNAAAGHKEDQHILAELISAANIESCGTRSPS